MVLWGGQCMKPGLSPSNKINTLYPHSGVPPLKLKAASKKSCVACAYHASCNILPTKCQAARALQIQRFSSRCRIPCRNPYSFSTSSDTFF